MAIKDVAKTKYKNPDKTIDFTFKPSDTIEEILYEEGGVPRNPDYEDAEKIVSEITRLANASFTNSLYRGLNASVVDAYKTAEGEYVDSYEADELGGGLEIDPKVKIVSIVYSDTNKETGFGAGYNGVSTSTRILPLSSKDKDYLNIICIEKDEASLEFEGEGAEITNRNLDISLATLRR